MEKDNSFQEDIKFASETLGNILDTVVINADERAKYEELKRVGEGLLLGSDDSSLSESEESEDERVSSPVAESTSQISENLVPEDVANNLGQMAIEDDSEYSEDEKDQEKDEWESTLTVKYINGELSFSELADIMERKNSGEATEVIPIAVPLHHQHDKGIGDKLEEEYQITVKQKRKRKVRRLPKDLQGLMGEANLCFARGDHEDAVKMCMEVIRLAPRASEPFQTIGMIYEETGDQEKALQFYFIGAYLSPNDPEEWLKLAQMSLEHDHLKQAITCYTQALKCDSSNIHIQWERCTLYERLGEKKKALSGYEAILDALGSEQGEMGMQLCREIAKLHHDNKDIVSAISVMQRTCEKYQGHITSEDVNMLLELQIGQRMFVEAIQVLCLHCGITFLDGEEDDANIVVYDQAVVCMLPEGLPIDLQAKLATCLIHLKCYQLAEGASYLLWLESPEEMGDLFLDIAEAYMDVGHYENALAIFQLLVDSENYNLAAVWLRYAECLNAQGLIEQATAAYQRVVDMAPGHFGARMALSSLLQQVGRTDEAISALKQECEDGQMGVPIDPQLLFQRCNLLYSQQLWPEFFKAADLMFNWSCYPVKTSMEYQVVLHNQSYKRRREAMRDIENTPEATPISARPIFNSNSIAVDEFWAFFLKTWQKMYDMKMYDLLENISIRSLTSHILSKHHGKDIDFLALLACFKNQNHDFAYALAKDLAIKEINNNRAWNLFSQVLSMIQDIRHSRFCLRLSLKNQDHRALSLLNGHTAMISGSYKHALGEYIGLYKEDPEDAFLAFSVGLTFLHMASQKFASKRHSLVIQGMAFLDKYQALRGESQETYYTLGRSMHMLGLTNIAVHHYKKALSLPPPISDNNEVFDLRREIAFNLILIYKSSHAETLSHYYTKKYLVI